MKNKIVKRIGYKLIKLCPNNYLRILIYKFLFNYKIGKKVIIGKSIINCRNASIGNGVVIRNNVYISCKNLIIGNNTSIHSDNIIKGRSSFLIGENSRIINNHYIDVWNNVEVGNNTWLAGRNSEIWTHGSIHTKTNSKDLSVKIGDNVYISSNTKIAPGVKIGSYNLIGLGSVVLNSIESSKNIIVGNPAKIVKENIDWRENW